MQTLLLLHSIVRWVIVLFGLWTLVNAFSGVAANRSFTATDNRTNLFFLISCDIQLLIGLALYFINGWAARLSNLGAQMQNTYSRFYTMEHEIMMLLAIVLVHIGRASVKKASTDRAKHKKALLFFGLAIIIILASVPWPFRDSVGKAWL